MKTKNYVPPKATTVAFTIEHGYGDSDSHKLGLTEGVGDIQLEERQTADSDWGNYWNI